MKNIAIVVPTLNKGGGERVAANLSLEFSKYFNVYVIVHDGNDVTYPYSGKKIDLKLPPADSKIGKLKTMIKRTIMLKRIKKKYDIDYTISHLPPSNYINIFSRTKGKIFTYVHSMENETKWNKIRMKLVAALSDKVICVSECVRQNVIKFGVSEKKAITIYNFCSSDFVENFNFKKESDEIVIFNMGRLAKPKGQWHLIKAMSLVVQKHKNVSLQFIGDGELKNYLEEIVDKFELKEHVKFIGFLEKPFEKLKEGDIYVSSSLWEGLPMALVEAGMCGLPIISTDCDAGCREIIAPDTNINKKTRNIEEAKYGILVPVCKEESEFITKEEQILADAIIKLIDDINIRYEYSKKARKGSEEFLPEKIMDYWFKILV